VANAFISPFNTQSMHIKSFYTQQHCYVSLKTLYPGGIRTRVFLFLRRMRCPLRHAAIGQLFELMFKIGTLGGSLHPGPYGRTRVIETDLGSHAVFIFRQSGLLSQVSEDKVLPFLLSRMNVMREKISVAKSRKKPGANPTNSEFTSTTPAL
jgi:hypothetical protein